MCTTSSNIKILLVLLTKCTVVWHDRQNKLRLFPYAAFNPFFCATEMQWISYGMRRCRLDNFSLLKVTVL